MAYRSIELVQGGIKHSMPLMGFGTFRLTGYTTVYNALDNALASGYRFIDTAQAYENESDIGQSLKELLPKHKLQREDIFLTTKLHPKNMSEGSATVRSSIIESLKDLQTTYVDLFLIHYPAAGFGTSEAVQNRNIRRESWLELEKIKKDGLAKFVGVSNYTTKHLTEMDEYCTMQPAVNQCEYHPHMTRPDLVKMCQDKRIHFQAFTSLGRNDPSLVGDPVIVDIAKKHNSTVAQVLLAWPMAKDISVIPKSSQLERIRSNFVAVNVKLDPEEIIKLDNLDKGKNYTKCTPWLVS